MKSVNAFWALFNSPRWMWDGFGGLVPRSPMWHGLVCHGLSPRHRPHACDHQPFEAVGVISLLAEVAMI